MWRKDTIGVIVVALCTCVVAAGPGSDPNQAWDPADHFAAVWASVSADLSARIYNPALPPVLWGIRPKRLLSMTAQITVTDNNGLVSLSRTAAGVHALDQNGHVIPVSQTDNDSGRLYYWFPSRMTQPTPGIGYTIWFDLDSAISQIPYPSLLRRVEWSMYALVTQTFRTVDVPFQVSNQWIELVPGLEILVGQTTLATGKYEYRILARCDPTKVSYVPGRAIYLAPGDLPPEVIVTKIDVLDANGNSIPAQGQGTFSSTSGVGTIFTSIPGAAYQGPGGSSTGSGTCPACGTATTIRYTLALKPYEKEVRFVLENVPVPLF